LDIKSIVDSLAVVGAPIAVDDHIDVILNGLSFEFDPFVASILSRKNSYIIAEIEAFLLA